MRFLISPGWQKVNLDSQLWDHVMRHPQIVLSTRWFIANFLAYAGMRKGHLEGKVTSSSHQRKSKPKQDINATNSAIENLEVESR
ncbi:hypothetical protein RRG08_013292 [Elysia crispata]|uniref:Uncharacterized protein n=1 Tax=Elysia crispata TaxID=231223 RepID=A0AAE1AZ84_9GAST|nr:hypothetical protein RRG08_013292 [Elysia crispata]